MGGKSKTTTKIPEWVRGPAERNLHRAEEASQIGYVPYYGPTLAAFNPMQNQAFANIGAGAQAFGLAGPGEMFQPTMQARDFGNGMIGHSSGELYDLALADLAARRPGQFDAINNLFLDPLTGRPRQPAPGMGPVAPPNAVAPGATTRDDSPMWSDGMTGDQIRAEREARTFGQAPSYSPSGGSGSIGGLLGGLFGR